MRAFSTGQQPGTSRVYPEQPTPVTARLRYSSDSFVIKRRSEPTPILDLNAKVGPVLNGVVRGLRARSHWRDCGGPALKRLQRETRPVK